MHMGEIWNGGRYRDKQSEAGVKHSELHIRRRMRCMERMVKTSFRAHGEPLPKKHSRCGHNLWRSPNKRPLIGMARTRKLTMGQREVFQSRPAQASTWFAGFAPDLEAAVACSTEYGALLVRAETKKTVD